MRPVVKTNLNFLRASIKESNNDKIDLNCDRHKFACTFISAFISVRVIGDNTKVFMGTGHSLLSYQIV